MFSLDTLKTNEFSWQAAQSLAFASKISYEEQSIVENVVTHGWGFSSVKFLDVGETQGFVAQTEETILIAFRGTESLGDWLANLRIIRTARSYGKVHSGFLTGYLVVHSAIVNAIEGATNKRVWITGHSLGGALATIAAAELKELADIGGVYTYGQPRVGDSALEQFFVVNYSNRLFRFVNDDDLVTRSSAALQTRRQTHSLRWTGQLAASRHGGGSRGSRTATLE